MLVDIDEYAYYNYVELSIGYLLWDAATWSRHHPRSSPLKVYNYIGT